MDVGKAVMLAYMYIYLFFVTAGNDVTTSIATNMTVTDPSPIVSTDSLSFIAPPVPLTVQEYTDAKFCCEAIADWMFFVESEIDDKRETSSEPPSAGGTLKRCLTFENVTSNLSGTKIVCRIGNEAHSIDSEPVLLIVVGAENNVTAADDDSITHDVTVTNPSTTVSTETIYDQSQLVKILLLTSFAVVIVIVIAIIILIILLWYTCRKKSAGGLQQLPAQPEVKERAIAITPPLGNTQAQLQHVDSSVVPVEMESTPQTDDSSSIVTGNILNTVQRTQRSTNNSRTTYMYAQEESSTKESTVDLNTSTTQAFGFGVESPQEVLVN